MPSSATGSAKEGKVDEHVITSDFVQEQASQPLRVCCYGSSSAKTPERYMSEARNLGYILAKRGHTCVNGAGSFGCMAAMNDGAAQGKGHIVGVIHEMFLIDDGGAWGDAQIQRDGGAHPVFENAKKNKNKNGPIREILLAGGNDLQERKRLLVDKANALVVLPGGPGTWDELWEMACARQLGLSQLPIVCVNIDGYYDSFREMLERAWKDKLTALEPEKIVHFENTAEGAVRWIETIQSVNEPKSKLKRRSEVGRSSFISYPVLGKTDSWFVGMLSRSTSFISEIIVLEDENGKQWLKTSMIFGTGIAAGLFVAHYGHNRKL